MIIIAACCGALIAIVVLLTVLVFAGASGAVCEADAAIEESTLLRKRLGGGA